MNILTFDIEEWALAKAGGYGTEELYAKYEDCLDKILELLGRQNIKATFFCTGAMAKDFPHIVQKIDCAGYEVGCHSYSHSWLNKMSFQQCNEDISSAVKALEDCLGKKVTSFRAPAFSIGEENVWVFDIFAENGITTDSSIFPAKRDFGGFPSFYAKTPCLISHNGVNIKEYPIGLANLFGRDVAYSGGGYFRLLPLFFINNNINNAEYSMCYFHISDLISEISTVHSRQEYEDYFKEKGTLLNRYKRYFKSNIGKKRAWNKFESLIEEHNFVDIVGAGDIVDWTKAIVINP